MKDYYINAVLELIKKGADIQTVLSGLSATLAKKGHTRLHGNILKGVLRILSHNKARGTVVTVANEKTLTLQKEAIQKSIESLKGDATPKVVIDPTIIGGVIVECNNMRIDTSHKSRLVKLYRSITT